MFKKIFYEQINVSCNKLIVAIWSNINIFKYDQLSAIAYNRALKEIIIIEY